MDYIPLTEVRNPSSSPPPVAGDLLHLRNNLPVL